MALNAKKSNRSSEAKQAALDEATREEVTRLNALIPESLHKQLKMQAAREGKGVTITSILIKAANEYLRKCGNE